MSAVIYVVDFGDCRVKVGRSRRPSSRFNAYIREYEGICCQMYLSGRLHEFAAELAENELIDTLAQRFRTWRGREWFCCPLSEALDAMRGISAYYEQWRLLEALPPKDWPERWQQK